MIGQTNAVEDVNLNTKGQLINYTMLYDSGNECADITGGWEAFSINETYKSVGTLTKNVSTMYFTVSGSQTSGPGTINKVDFTGYKYAVVLQTFKATSATWETAWLAVSDAMYSYNIRENIGQNIEVTTPTLYKIDVSEVASGHFSTTLNYSGNITLYSAFLVKEDDWQRLSELAGITASTIEELLTNSSTLLSNKNAVKFMIKQCTGDFMLSALQSDTFLTALNSSAYKTIIQANEHWNKFLNMVA